MTQKYQWKQKTNYPKKKKSFGYTGPKLATEQLDAADKIISTKTPHLICGRAGSGKSTLLNYIKNTKKKTAMTATTGLAAQLIGGHTLHSYAGIIPGRGAIESSKANYRVKHTDLLIVDEASMMDEWLFLELMKRFEMAGNEPKLLLSGDFLQIPPVKSEPFYKSDYFKLFEIIKLTQNHRQSNPEFIDVLNDIRVGNYSQRVRDFIKSRTVDKLPEDCTHLMSLRAKVEKRNLEKLNALDGKEYSFLWEVVKYSFEEKDLDKLNNVRMPRELLLKIGARVMMLNNDMEKRWVNGSTGIVTEINEQLGIIHVRLDCGYIIDVMTETEEITNADDEILFTVKQFPIMLAFANSIHKSQGSTLDRVGIDLSNHFETALTYVAFSRCKTPEGIYLCGNLDSIKTDIEAVKLFG